MSDEENFKITDRRRRFDDADSRPASARGDSPPPAEPPAAAAPSPTEVPAEAELGVESELDETADPDLGGGPNLRGVFVMFGSSALIALGAAPDPMTGQRSIDLDQAQEAIETLMLLGVKTEGNRTDAETRLLEELLHDLQARFIRLTQGG